MLIPTHLRNCLILGSLFTLGAFSCSAQDSANEKKASYLTIQVPRAFGTYPVSVNNAPAESTSFAIGPEVAGYYLVSPTVANGFFRYGDGVIVTFSAPGAVWTEPVSMNIDGDITGFYQLVAGGAPHGFIWLKEDGAILTFDPPFAAESGPQTLPVSINKFKEVAGNFLYPVGSSEGFSRSTVGAAFNGVYTMFGFGQGADQPTFVTGLNDSGTIVGYFPNNGDSVVSSFILHPDGVRIPFVAPLNEDATCLQQTIAESINASGAIAGIYSGYAGTAEDPCATTQTGGFVRSPEGVFSLFNPPGPIVTSPLQTLPENGGTLSAPSRLSINASGVIVGSYTDTSGAQHAFVRDPYGVITPFDPPRGRQTTATSINDSGVITGYFYWSDATPVGFLRTPITKP